METAGPLIDGRTIRAIEDTCHRLGISRQVLALEHDAVQAPLTCRLWKPVIIFPSGFASQLSDRELRAVIVHECAHIKRHDSMLLTSSVLIRALFFMQPLVWIAAREMSILSEHAMR